MNLKRIEKGYTKTRICLFVSYNFCDNTRTHWIRRLLYLFTNKKILLFFRSKSLFFFNDKT